MNNICTFLGAVSTDEENQERDEKNKACTFSGAIGSGWIARVQATNNSCTFFKRTWQWGSGPGPRCQESVGHEKCTSTNQGSRYMVHGH